MSLGGGLLLGLWVVDYCWVSVGGALLGLCGWRTATRSLTTRSLWVEHRKVSSCLKLSLALLGLFEHHHNKNNVFFFLAGVCFTPVSCSCLQLVAWWQQMQIEFKVSRREESLC